MSNCFISGTATLASLLRLPDFADVEQHIRFGANRFERRRVALLGGGK
jgi:hypothetical protein